MQEHHTTGNSTAKTGLIHEHHVLLAISALDSAMARGQQRSALVNVKLADAIRGFSPRTVDRIKAHPWNWETADSFINNLKEGWSETAANDFLALSGALPDKGLAQAVAWHVHSHKLYSGLFPPNNKGEYPEERLSQILALFTVTEQMIVEPDQDPYMTDDMTGENMLYIFNPELQSLLLHPGKYQREEVVRVIVDTSTFDAERIKMIIDSDASSLGSGIL